MSLPLESITFGVTLCGIKLRKVVHTAFVFPESFPWPRVPDTIDDGGAASFISFKNTGGNYVF